MKKNLIISVIVLMIFIISFNFASGADGLEYYDGFDYNNGIVPPNWQAGPNTTYRGCQVTVSNKKLSLFYAGNNMNFPVINTLPTPFENTRVLISLDVKLLEDNDINCQEIPRIYGLDGENKTALSTIQIKDGKLYYANNNGEKVSYENIPVAIQSGKTIKIGFDIDLINGRQDIYIYPENGERTVLTGKNLQVAGCNSVSGMELWFSNSSNTGTFIIDNVHFREYSEEGFEGFSSSFSYNDKQGAMTELKNTLRSDDIVLMINSPYVLLKRSLIKLDENDTGIMPYLNNGVAMVPLRFIAEVYDAIIDYDDSSGEVYLLYKNTEIRLKADTDEYYENGKVKHFLYPPESKNGRTMVPLRLICEAFGKKVLWDDSGIIAISRRDKLFEDSKNVENIKLILSE